MSRSGLACVTGRPSRPGWLSTQEAADRLGVKPREVHHLVKRGHLRSSRSPLRVWVTAESVEARRAQQVDDRDRYVSYVEAARIDGCSLYAIKQAVNARQIEHRSAPRREPSLLRSSVEAFARSQRREPVQTRTSALYQPSPT
jgi:excisionase family DNA binding protein